MTTYKQFINYNLGVPLTLFTLLPIPSTNPNHPVFWIKIILFRLVFLRAFSSRNLVKICSTWARNTIFVQETPRCWDFWKMKKFNFQTSWIKLILAIFFQKFKLICFFLLDFYDLNNKKKQKLYEIRSIVVIVKFQSHGTLWISLSDL